MRSKIGGLVGKGSDGARHPGFASTQVTRLSGATKNYVGLIVVLAGILVLFGVTESQFLNYSNMSSVFSTEAPLFIVGFALTITLIQGGFDLSLSGILILAGVVVAELSNHGMPIGLAIVVTIVGALLFGALANGLPIAKYGLNFFVVTLASLSVSGGLALVIANGQTLNVNSHFLDTLGAGEVGKIPYTVIVAAVIFVLCVLLMRYTGLGRMIYMVGGNPEAARLAGINVTAVRITTYSLGAGLSAIAGILSTATLVSAASAADPTILLTAAAAVFLGGTSFAGGSGTMLGTLLGVTFLAILQNGLLIGAVSVYWQGVIIGAVLLLSISVDRIRQRTRSPVPRAAGPTPNPAASGKETQLTK